MILLRKPFLVMLLAAFVVTFVAIGLFSFTRLPFRGSVFQYPQSFQANDFVGTWINLVPSTPESTSVISYLIISNNQGTYTIDAHQINYYSQYGSLQQGDLGLCDTCAWSFMHFGSCHYWWFHPRSFLHDKGRNPRRRSLLVLCNRWTSWLELLN
jgi:hypothetical protein